MGYGLKYTLFNIHFKIYTIQHYTLVSSLVSIF